MVVFRGAHVLLALLPILVVRRFQALPCGRDAVIKPRVGFGVGFSLPGPAGGGAVKAAAVSVFLYVDLPAVIFFVPCRCVRPLPHICASPSRLCVSARAFCLRRVIFAFSSIVVYNALQSVLELCVKNRHLQALYFVMMIARPLSKFPLCVNWRWAAPGRQHGRGGPSPTPFNVKAVQGIRQTVHKAVFCISVKSDISYRSGRWRVWTEFPRTCV